ncbi:MAG: hypothetical protein FJ386_11785 [Verrucomicrobia bacterium]|nr:hypothetical protein [Verrucomicrobiota bacterium]
MSAAAGKAGLFDALKGCLMGARAPLPCLELGAKPGMSEGARPFSCAPSAAPPDMTAIVGKILENAATARGAK